MSHPTRFLGAAALALSLISADLVRDGHDLRPRFEEGQELTIRSEVSLVLGLDDATAQMGGMEVIPEVPTVNVEVEAVEEITEKILAVADGAVTKLRRTHQEEGVQFSGEFGMGSDYQDFDDSQEGPLQGRTLEISVGEDGVSVEDVTEGEVDELENSALAMVTEKSHFEQLLPTRPVEIGGTWDVGEAMMEEINRALSSAASEGPEAAKMLEVLDTLKDSFEFDAKGKLLSVDDDVARIEWRVKAELMIDDLFSIIREVADPDEIAELPESAEGSLDSRWRSRWKAVVCSTCASTS